MENKCKKSAKKYPKVISNLDTKITSIAKQKLSESLVTLFWEVNYGR